MLFIFLSNAAHAQTADQIANFKDRIMKAWASGKNVDFESLYCLDMSPDVIRAMTSMGWQSLKQLKDPKIEGFEFIPIDEVKKRIESNDERAKEFKSIIELAEQKRIYKDVEYESNLPLVGVLLYKFRSTPSEEYMMHSGTKLSPVGMKHGLLLFPSMRPTK